MGSKLTQTGVKFGNLTTEQTKPVTEVNQISATDSGWNNSGDLTVDIGMTSEEYTESLLRIIYLERFDRQSLSWGSTQEKTVGDTSSVIVVDVPDGCVMVGFYLRNLHDTNAGADWHRDGELVIPKILYKYIANNS